MSGNSSNILRKSVKHGIGRLTASAGALSRHATAKKPVTTRLTQVAHKAPTRLIPLKKTSVERAGAAVCALSNYGAGMLQGDSAELSMHVESGAKLGVVTQGAARIYTQLVPGVCKAKMDVRVEKDGVLVYAPDPCTLFASSSYSQIQDFNIHPESSIALIDWISSGRYKNQERWEFDKLNVRTTLKWLEEKETIGNKSEKAVSRNTVNDAQYKDIPFLKDSVSIDMRSNKKDPNRKEDHDPYAVEDFNCFASLIIYGEHMELVKEECQFLSDSFAAQYTRIRQREQHNRKPTEPHVIKDIGDFKLAGRVIMGISKVALPGKPSDAYVFRCAGKSNEDIYRIFHHCLKPLTPSFGFEFYKDRILAQRSEIPTQRPEKEEGKDTEISKDIKSLQTQAKIDPCSITSLDSYSKPLETSSSFWSIVMLADSGLPTGSFAHSAGLEAAAQLGMIRREEDVRIFVQAATRSSMQLLAPFLVAGLRITQDENHDGHRSKSVRDRWEKLHRECQAVMVTNEPACSASLDQGKSLVRVASQWLSGAQETSLSSRVDSTILKYLKNGSPPHLAPALGVIGGLLGLDEIQVCRLFAYCMARDLVSSAVRLSLIGPLASVPLLHNVQESIEDGIRAVYQEIQNHPDDPLSVAATSAPVIEALHPCHEILQVRLFRS